MNKFKVLGAALMVSILIGILSAHQLGLTSVQHMHKDTWTFLLTLSGLCVILFGSLAALELDNSI